ncbi:MAG: hypothetical protein AB2L14_17005 [Candidatus Xenobiia bacterium LiM19]
MKSTAEEMFAGVIPHISEYLVSSEVISLFKELFEKFPEKLTDDVLFECPLGMDDAVSDLSLFVNDRVREIIAGKREGAEIEESLLRSQAWKRIRSFCEKWFLREIYQNKGGMWLEFDLESLRKATPLPGIFFNGRISAEKDLLSHKLNRYKCLINKL